MKEDQRDTGGVIKPRKLSKNNILSRLIEAERKLRESQEIIQELRKDLLEDINSNAGNYSDW